MFESWRRQKPRDAERTAAQSPFDEDEQGSWEPGIIDFALDGSELHVTLLPGAGQADGGVAFIVPASRVPVELRTPGTRMMALRRDGGVVAVRAPGPKASTWFRCHVDLPRTRADVPEYLAQSPGHVVVKLRTGRVLEGWVLDHDPCSLAFAHAPSPLFAQVTGSGDMAPPDERLHVDDMEAFMDDGGTWQPMPRA